MSWNKMLIQLWMCRDPRLRAQQPTQQERGVGTSLRAGTGSSPSDTHIPGDAGLGGSLWPVREKAVVCTSGPRRPAASTHLAATAWVLFHMGDKSRSLLTIIRGGTPGWLHPSVTFLPGRMLGSGSTCLMNE